MNSNQPGQDRHQSADKDKSPQSGTAAPGEHEPNDLAGGLPMSPGGHHLAADQKMDDDTGLSNTANLPRAEPDPAVRQELQSNVGRRDDGTPD